MSFAQDNVAPHGPTVRAAYIVPANRKAFVSGISIVVVRSAAATAVGNLVQYVTRTLIGGTPRAMGRGNISLLNAVGDRDRTEIGQGLILQAGQEFQLLTQDNSTDGTLNYAGACQWVEFDA